MKLIDKDVLVAEIERRIKEIDEIGTYLSPKGILTNLLCHIDTIEVKEVDLDEVKKESLAQDYIDYTFKRHNIDPDSMVGQLIYYAYIHGMNQCLTQLRTQK